MSKVVPEGWVQGELAEFCDVVGGGTPDRNNPDFWGGDIPWVSPTEITGNTSKYISQTKEKITEIGLEKSSAKLHPAGTLLMTSRASIGFVAINTVPMATNQGFQSLRCKKKVLVDFLYQYIIWSRPQLERLAAGSTFAEISSANVKRMTVCFPSVEQQQKIATILSSVDNVIEKTRTQIDKLKDLKTGMMQELLTKGIGHTEFKDSPVGRIPKSWDAVELGSISKLERGRFSHRPRNEPKFYNGSIPFLQTGDIPKEAPNITTFSQTLNEKGLKVSKLFPKGTLVITIAATIGEIGILEFDSCFPDSLVGIKVNQKKANPVFVLYLMRHLKDELESLAPQTAQKNINLDILQPFQIPLPSLEEQELIASSMYSVDIKINTLLKKLENTKNTKKALMQDLLTGKTRTI